MNLTRGEWLCSHVYAVLARAEPALHHAHRALAVCEEHGIGGFDLAYAYEGMARALACAGDPAAPESRQRAADAAADVADPGDRTILEADLASGPWFDLRDVP